MKTMVCEFADTNRQTRQASRALHTTLMQRKITIYHKTYTLYSAKENKAQISVIHASQIFFSKVLLFF